MSSSASLGMWNSQPIKEKNKKEKGTYNPLLSLELIPLLFAFNFIPFI